MRHTTTSPPASKEELGKDSIRLVFDASRPLPAQPEPAKIYAPRHQLTPITPLLSSEILCTLQPFGDGDPLFCFHHGAGTVTHFGEFAEQFTHNRPVFGLQSPFLLKRPALMPKLDQLALRYTDAIMRLCPQERCHLVGWDQGGIVAFEVARNLMRQSIEVSSLSLLDCISPMAYEHPHHIDEAQLLDLFIQDIAGFSGITVPRSADRLRSLSSQQIRLEQAFALFSQFPHLNLQRDEFEERYQSYKMIVTTCLKYWPKPYSGPITLFRSSAAAADDSCQSADMGWKKFCAQEINTVDIAASHYTMLKQQAIKQIAEHIRNT